MCGSARAQREVREGAVGGYIWASGRLYGVFFFFQHDELVLSGRLSVCAGAGGCARVASRAAGATDTAGEEEERSLLPAAAAAAASRASSPAACRALRRRRGGFACIASIMAKKHSQAKEYITNTEWKNEWGGHKKAANLPFRRLPFHCCSLAFTPFDAENAVCTEDGAVRGRK